MSVSFSWTAELSGPGGGRMGMAGFDVIDREQGQAQVARFLQQAVERGLVGYGAMDDGGAVAAVGEASPSNQAAHRLSRCPLRRISYRPGPSWRPADISLMVLLCCCPPGRISAALRTFLGLIGSYERMW